MQDVDHEVDQHERDREDDDRALQREEVAVVDGIDGGIDVGVAGQQNAQGPRGNFP